MFPKSPNTNFSLQKFSAAAHPAHGLPLCSPKAPGGAFLLPLQSTTTLFLPAKVVTNFPSPILMDNVQIMSADIHGGMRHSSHPGLQGSPSYLPTGSYSFYHFLPKCTFTPYIPSVSIHWLSPLLPLSVPTMCLSEPSKHLLLVFLQ